MRSKKVRSKKEIMKDVSNPFSNYDYFILEVLIDIRDELVRCNEK